MPKIQQSSRADDLAIVRHAIEASPGVTIREIMAATGLGRMDVWNLCYRMCARGHIHRLLTGAKSSRIAIWFPGPGAGKTSRHGRQSPERDRILSFVAAFPGRTSEEIAKMAGTPRGNISYHLPSAKKLGLVRMVVENTQYGTRGRWFPTAKLPARVEAPEVARLLKIVEPVRVIAPRIKDPNGCKFIAGDPRDHLGMWDELICGRPMKPDSVYCPEHHAVCWMTLKPKIAKKSASF